MDGITGVVMYGLLAALLVGAATVGATGLVLRELRRRAILDLPNHRSSHTIATPRGGGLAVTPVVLAAWAVLALIGGASGPGWVLVLVAALVLGLVSWRDDLKSLPAGIRFAVQAAAVVAGLAVLPSEMRVFQGWLPLPLDRLVAAIGWLWFVNLFNFMDGIDGITGAQLVAIGAGLALVVLAAGGPADLLPLSLTLAAAGGGFLVWNWHKAKVFLGDVGSVPLGYLTGWLLIWAAAAGLWPAVVILPLYYLADATLTLLRRLARGATPWQAHREHAYQQAVQGGLDHARVVLRIALANSLLVVCALVGVWIGGWALVPATAIVAVLLIRLKAAGKSQPAPAG